MTGSSPAIEKKLKTLRQDFANATGSSFRSFYCPLLLRDEDVPLCKAHVVTQALTDASDAWTVQRQDVDNFYGSVAEATFTKLEVVREWDAFRTIVNRPLRAQLVPRIRVNGRAVEFFIPNGPIPEGLSTVELSHDAKRYKLALKISPAELSGLLDDKWEIGIELDIRAPALASLIKSAFLTAFELGGYAYALSETGRLVGSDLLGRFFTEAKDLPRMQKVQRLAEFFEPCSRMLRPVLSEEPLLRGTIDDGKALACWSPLGFHWGIIVFVRAAGLHSVLLPLEGGPRVRLAYQQFLDSDSEELSVRSVQFVDGAWRGTQETATLDWPKA